MKITVSKSVFVQTIAAVAKAAASKSTIAVLSGVKIVADDKGLHMSATNLETGIECRVPNILESEIAVEVHEAGSIVLPAKYLLEVVKKSPSKKIEIETKQGSTESVIKSGRSKSTLQGYDSNEFPNLPNVNDNHIFTIESRQLKKMIERTVFAVSSEQVRPVLTGVKLYLVGDSLTFVATDSHRLSKQSATVNGLKDQSLLVPALALRDLLSLLNDSINDVIHVAASNSHIMFQTKNSTFYSRLLDGQYPDISRIIPNNFTTTLKVKSKELQGATERASLIARDNENNSILMNAKEDGVLVESKSASVGRSNEHVEIAEFVGDGIELSVNAQFVLDILKVMHDDELKISFVGGLSPFVITIPDEPDFLHLILPMRTA